MDDDLHKILEGLSDSNETDIITNLVFLAQKTEWAHREILRMLQRSDPDKRDAVLVWIKNELGSELEHLNESLKRHGH